MGEASKSASGRPKADFEGSPSEFGEKTAQKCFLRDPVTLTDSKSRVISGAGIGPY